MPRILSMAGGAIGALVLTSLAIAPPASADPASLKGSAFAVKAEVKAVGAPLLSVPALPEAKYTPGADKSVLRLTGSAVTDQSRGLVDARVLNARSYGSEGMVASRASAADILVGLQASSKNKQAQALLGLSAELITAECKIGPNGVETDSKLVDVKLRTVAGQSKPLVDLAAGVQVEAPAPNTEVNVPGVGKVVLNEQIKTDKGVTVNAIHVKVDPALKLVEGDIIVSQAHCFNNTSNDDPTGEPSEPGESPEPTATATDEPTNP
ncbi:MAG: choice-of-anchor P family protein, partial [Micromonosporaceae bacterium]